MSLFAHDVVCKHVEGPHWYKELLQQLKDIDQVAYVRFASVYRKFDNIDSFMAELKALKKLDAKKAKK